MLLKRVSILFICLLLIAPCISAKGNGSGPGGNSPDNDEIYLIVLDELFVQASNEWKVEPEILWEAYQAENLRVKRVEGEWEGKEAYEVVSQQFGTLKLKVNKRNADDVDSEDDFSLSNFMDDAESQSAADAESSESSN